MTGPLVGFALDGESIVCMKEFSYKETNNDKLVRNNQLLEIAEEIASLGHWQWDLATNEVIWSKNLYEVFSHDHAVSVTFDVYFGYVHPEDKQYVTDTIQDYLKNKKFEGFFHKVLLNDGTEKYIQLLGRVILDAQDEPVEMIGTCQDVTEQQLAYRHMEKKCHEVQRFITLASHDLKDPINSIKGLTEILLEKADDKEDEISKGSLLHMQKTVERMEGLVTELLDHVRFGENIKFQQVDLNQLIQQNLSDLHHLIERKKARITTTQLPTVIGSSTELRLMLQNLLSNALKYVAESIVPVIHISAVEDKEFWTFSVQDNGIGIPANDRKRVFGLFERLKLNDVDGTGIGLAHCKKVVELHGGRIWVQSELGHGSIFKFTISKSLVS